MYIQQNNKTVDDCFYSDDLGKLPFLTLCIKESLRLNTVAPMIMRKCEQPLTFQDGRVAPKGLFFARIISFSFNKVYYVSEMSSV